MLKKQLTVRTVLVLATLLLIQGCTNSPVIERREIPLGKDTRSGVEEEQTPRSTDSSTAQPQKTDQQEGKKTTAIIENVATSSLTTGSNLTHGDAKLRVHKRTAPIPKMRQVQQMAPMTQVARMKSELIVDFATGSHLQQTTEYNRESYNYIVPNPLVITANDPLSTFSIDVDTASYANVRRWLNDGKLPPVGAIRVEEMINYFNYNYQDPDEQPISITTEVGPCLWQPEHKIVRIGLKAKGLDSNNMPPSNLVFLIDVSGSMNQRRKLPLLQQAMLLLTDQLSVNDRISIVVYAGSDKIVLPPTSGDQKNVIKKAISSLRSRGSTHGSAGIKTAYQLAKQLYMPKGNNRVILASDGDFNVGVTSRGELEKLIAKEKQSGVYLTVLGFGMGNYHDDTMELLADKGNGNYSYIDNLLEAKKVLLKERASTLYTLARDVKLQIEFNPQLVAAYKLIGYENRLLADADFNDDKKDAGEIGAGHTVTALYEILPPKSKNIPVVDRLKYQDKVSLSPHKDELLTVKLRYKPSEKTESVVINQIVEDRNTKLSDTSDDFRFASAVAGFGTILKQQSPHTGLEYADLLKIAGDSKGSDKDGYRAELIRLIEMAELLQSKADPLAPKA